MTYSTADVDFQDATQVSVLMNNGFTAAEVTKLQQDKNAECAQMVARLLAALLTCMGYQKPAPQPPTPRTPNSGL